MTYPSYIHQGDFKFIVREKGSATEMRALNPDDVSITHETAAVQTEGKRELRKG